MGKAIVVCSDGTGNRDIKGRGTNVFKLFEAVDLNGHRTDPALRPQIALYDDGVGTEDFKPLKVFAGATGFGLSRNVRQLYREIARIYDPGDDIYLFGFSRGAFTVRTLAGFIGTCGIVDASRTGSALDLRRVVRRAYRIYRKRYVTPLQSLFYGPPDPAAVERFKTEHCHPDSSGIAFIGVWDTVDAVGMPFHLSDVINLTVYRFKFPDPYLGRHVARACHAVALDDERASFAPLVWQPRSDADRERIEQVWFAGVHSNVGGGYPKQGMSLVTLEWMLQNAHDAGLRVLVRDRELYREHANVDDKLYDSRAGVGMFYRWKPRDMAQICADNAVAPVLHLSVLERTAHGTDDYAPGNLAPTAAVTFTRTGDRAKDEAAALRAAAVQAVLRAGDAGDGRSLLSRVPGAIVVGRLSYYAYLATCTLAIVAASAPEGARTTPKAFAHNAWTLVVNIVTLDIGALFGTLKQLAGSPYLLLLLASGLTLAWALDRAAASRMSRMFGEFWHARNPALRAALKGARQAAAETRADAGTPSYRTS